MLAQQKQEIIALFQAALAPVLAGTSLAPAVVLERPRDASHGDVACNIAMQLAKQLKQNPRELAQTIVTAVLANPAGKGLIEAVEIAGPGFINVRVSNAAKHREPYRYLISYIALLINCIAANIWPMPAAIMAMPARAAAEF